MQENIMDVEDIQQVPQSHKHLECKCKRWMLAVAVCLCSAYQYTDETGKNCINYIATTEHITQIEGRFDGLWTKALGHTCISNMWLLFW